MASSTTSNGHLLRVLLGRIRYLTSLAGVSGLWPIRAFKDLVAKLLTNPHVAELLRFIFLGTIVETSRLAGQKAVDFTKHFFVVKASFTRGDFAFDWVKRYLEDHQVWDQSRVFRVSASNPNRRGFAHSAVSTANPAELTDGRPHPVYQPAPKEPELFRWRNHWISVNMNLDSASSEGVQVLTLSVWSRNRKILDDFVQEARAHYFNSPLPPRELYALPDESGSLLTARFNQGDISYDWMIAFTRAQEGYEEITDLQVTTKQSELPHSASGDPEDRPIATFKPAPRVKQRLRWREHWLQFDVEPSSDNYEGRSYGGSVTVTLHSSKRSVLYDLVIAARDEYLKNTTSKVTVHLADRYGSWVKCVTKNRRALSTLILPEGVKESLVDDAREFLDSEEWYTWAGVPHRRGYLLYGEPGTGKSSTIHALASELSLEIYYVQLASQGMDDHCLSRLIAETPSRSILLLEDIDCAFPSRDDDEDDEQPTDAFGNPVYTGYQPRSEVTLSGLLNVLDSVTSEEGRIVFATTNHIERLDPALIRAGRMDVKIEYKLATHHQISQTFLRFYEKRFTSNIERARPPVFKLAEEESATELPLLSDADIQDLSERFAELVPEGHFALAQVQGFLLTKKTDPQGAVNHVAKWVQDQIEEKQKIEDLKNKKKKKLKERAEEARRKAGERKGEDDDDDKGKVQEEKESKEGVDLGEVTESKVNEVPEAMRELEAINERPRQGDSLPLDPSS